MSEANITRSDTQFHSRNYLRPMPWMEHWSKKWNLCISIYHIRSWEFCSCKMENSTQIMRIAMILLR